MRFFVLFVVAVLVSACATDYQPISPVSSMKNLKGMSKLTLTWSGLFEGAKTDFYLKGMNNGSKLEVCGYYIESTGLHQDLMVKWINAAYITLDNQKIVSARFLAPQVSTTDAAARCVVTSTDYAASLHGKRFSIKGNRITANF